MRIALAQLNVVVGDLDGNVARIVAAVEEAQRAEADLVVLPELAVTGYPPEDLLLRPGFVRAAREAVDEVARACTGVVALVGGPSFERDLANAAFVCAEGRVEGDLPQALPAELRRLRRAPLLRGRPRAAAARARGRPRRARRSARTSGSPGRRRPTSRSAGATLIVNLSASPFHVGKAEEREEMLVTRARDNAAYVAFCNLVGGPGRARVRRPLRRARRRGRGDRARPRLRGGAARRRHRPDRGARSPSPRRPPPRARAVAARAAGSDDDPPRGASTPS